MCVYISSTFNDKVVTGSGLKVATQTLMRNILLSISPDSFYRKPNLGKRTSCAAGPPRGGQVNQIISGHQAEKGPQNE